MVNFHHRLKVQSLRVFKILFQTTTCVILSACVSWQPAPENIRSKYVGKNFYLAAAVIESPNKQKSNFTNSFTSISEFKKCEKFEVVEIHKWMSTGLSIDVKQGDKYFRLYTSSMNAPELALDKAFSSTFKFKERKVKFKEGTRSSLELLCSNAIWTGMEKNELIFALGEPGKINRTVGYGKIREQWVYGSLNTKMRFYYFEDDKLTSWQD